MDTHRSFLGIRMMDRVPNARIMELCGVKKGLDERIDEGVFQWFAHVERMERGIIAKRVYLGEFAGILSAGRPRKRWLDTVMECLKERCLDVRQARWLWFLGGGECIGHSPEDEPLTLTRCHSLGMAQLYEALERRKPGCGRAYNLKGIKGKFFCFSSFLSFVSFIMLLISWHDSCRPYGGGRR